MSLSGIVPNEAKYKIGGLPVSIDSARRVIKVFPQAGSSGYTPDTNGVIRIDLPPSLGFLDTHNSYLTFRVKGKQSNGSDTVDFSKECRMDVNSMSWCRTFSIISSSGSQLEHIDHYNLLVNLLHKATSPNDYTQSIAKMLDNAGGRASRNAKMAQYAGAQYCSGFDASGIFGGATPYLPLPFLQGSITIEMTLAKFEECFVGTSASNETASYQLDNVEYHASVIQFGQDYNSAFEQQLRQQGIDISFSSYRSHNTALTTAHNELQISQNAKSVKGVYQVLRSKAKYQSSKYDSLTEYKSGNLEECQWNLGGREYPEFPLKLKDSGVSALYAQNLSSFNMFRDHSLGSSVGDERFWTTEATRVPKGNLTASSYKSTPIRRVYGVWCANSPLYAIDSTEADVTFAKDPITGAALVGATNKCISHHVLPTLSFVPTNPRDVMLIEQGMRCKLGCKALPPDEATAVANYDFVKQDGVIINYHKALLNARADNANALVVKNAEGTTIGGSNQVTGLGLDRFYSSGPAQNYRIAGVKGAPVPHTATANTNSDPHKSRNIMYASAPTSIVMSHDGIIGTVADGGAVTLSGVKERTINGLGVHFYDAENNPIHSINDFVSFSGWVDIMPDDTDFFLGVSFETHQENSKLISGSDLTNATPLNCRLEYTSNTTTAASDFYENWETGDVLTTFVHYDAVLRLEPNGDIISSM